MSYVKKSVATLFAGAVLMTGAAAPATAANQNDQDGLVNVFVGDVNILNDARIGVAAQLAATLCLNQVKVGPIAVLGTAVDRSGTTTGTFVCETANGPLTLTQN